jgi:hypothetical protein
MSTVKTATTVRLGDLQERGYRSIITPDGKAISSILSDVGPAHYGPLTIQSVRFAAAPDYYEITLRASTGDSLRTCEPTDAKWAEEVIAAAKK